MLYVALVHFPVKNRLGEEIASTLDVFDFSDLGRLSLAYPLANVLWINPLASQREAFDRMSAHANDPERDVESRGSFEKLKWFNTLEEARLWVEKDAGARAWTVATTALHRPDSVTFVQVRHALAQAKPVLLLFGKAWGLAPAVIASADAVLTPIDEGTGFNHLSVRTAVAIVVDRLLRDDPSLERG
jgi:hypothetical protein